MSRQCVQNCQLWALTCCPHPGDQKVAAVHVADCAHAYMLALKHGVSGPRLPHHHLHPRHRQVRTTQPSLPRSTALLCTMPAKSGPQADKCTLCIAQSDRHQFVNEVAAAKACAS